MQLKYLGEDIIMKGRGVIQIGVGHNSGDFNLVIHGR